MAEVVSKSWYVIRAVSGQEAKIKDYIMAVSYTHLTLPTNREV